MTRHGLASEMADLRAERAIARADLVRSVDALAERAKDPLRLEERIRRHPVLAAGLAAGVGALLVHLLAARRGGEPAAPPRESGAGSADRATPDLLEVLRDTAVKAAVPWIRRFVDEHLTTNGTEADAANRVERAETGPRP